MTKGSECAWLYYKLRTTEQSWNPIEEVITDLIPRALAVAVPARWFFVRYRDEIGLHVRFRLAILNDRLTEKCEEVERTLEQWTRVKDNGTPILAMVEKDSYVPEIGKFGNEGIGIAEEVFQASSEIALLAIRNECQGGGSRKTLAPFLMQCVADAYVAEEKQKEFWESYAGYWLNFDPASAARWQGIYASKAREMAEQDVSVLSNSGSLGEPARQSIDSWRAVMGSSVRRFASVQQGDAGRRSNLAFEFIHLMNNRLGILAIAEAYLATLLAQQRDRSSL